MEDINQRLLKRFEELVGKRQIIEPIYKDIATYVRPQRLDGWYNQPQKGKQLYDSTAVVAADQFAACLWSFLCNGSGRWFHLKSTDIDDQKLEEIESEIYRAFDQFGFYGAAHELFRDLVSFGNGFFVSDSNEHAFSFKALHPMECVFSQDNKGEIVEIFRVFKLKDGDDEKELLHVVTQNKNCAFKAITALPWVSIVMERDSGRLVRKGGYKYLPYNVLRFSSSTGSHYGESPAMQALADIKMLNMMVKTNLMAAQKQIDPPLLVADELSAQGIRTYPGAVIYGGIHATSNKKLIEPLNTGSAAGLGFEMEEQRRRAIKEAFYYHITRDFNQMRSATEVVIDMEDRLRLVYPLVSRIFSEFIRPLLRHISAHIIERKFKEYKGCDLNFISLSPLAMAQKQQTANRLIQNLQALSPLFMVDSRLKNHIDGLVILKELAQGWGLPKNAILDDMQEAPTPNMPAFNMTDILQQLPDMMKGLSNGSTWMDASSEKQK